MEKKLYKRLDRVRKAYDLTVEQYNEGIDPLEQIPSEFKNTPDFKAFIKSSGLGSNAPDIKRYLNPKSGMNFLDAGCCANLYNYRLDRWPSTYYGVDISPALIKAMKRYASKNQISIGGLSMTDLSNLPFDDNFIDIAAVIGVLEYCTLEYIKDALTELNRVLKNQAKVVLDIPNPEHLYVNVMRQLEEYLGRPINIHARVVFEKMLRPLFSIEHCDGSRVMIKYFVRTRK